MCAKDKQPDAWASICCGQIVGVTRNKPRAPGDVGWEYYAKKGFSAPQPLYLGFDGLSDGVVAGLLERQRQISLGYTPEHDSQYKNSQLLKAAAVLMLKSAGISILRLLPYWPWDRKKLLGSDRSLTKALALLVAEIDRRQYSESRDKDAL